jgi:chromate transport protein ChrA
MLVIIKTTTITSFYVINIFLFTLFFPVALLITFSVSAFFILFQKDNKKEAKA